MTDLTNSDPQPVTPSVKDLSLLTIRSFLSFVCCYCCGRVVRETGWESPVSILSYGVMALWFRMMLLQYAPKSS